LKGVAGGYQKETNCFGAATPGKIAFGTRNTSPARDGASPVSTMLFAQQVGEGLDHDLATDVGYRRGQGNTLGANLDTVLSVATFLNAAVAHEGGKTLVLQSLAGGVRVEQAHLGNRGRAHKSSRFGELRTGFHTAAARDAVG